MTWLILAFLVYLLITMWVQIDYSGLSLKEAALNTFVCPWTYFFIGIPYLIYLACLFVYDSFRLEFQTRKTRW